MKLRGNKDFLIKIYMCMIEKTQSHPYLPVLMKCCFWGHKQLRLVENLLFNSSPLPIPNHGTSHIRCQAVGLVVKKHIPKFICTRVSPTFSSICISKEQSLKTEDRKSEEQTLIPNFSQSLSVTRCKALGFYALEVCFCKMELIMLPGRSGVGLQK